MLHLLRGVAPMAGTLLSRIALLETEIGAASLGPVVRTCFLTTLSVMLLGGRGRTS